MELPISSSSLPSREVIDTQLAKMKRKWSNRTHLPESKKVEFKKYFDEIPKIQQALYDEATLKKLARDAYRQCRDELESQIDPIIVNGKMESATWEKIQAASPLDKHDLDDLIQKRSISLLAPIDISPNTNPACFDSHIPPNLIPTDKLLGETITALHLLNETSIYTLIGTQPSDPMPVLKERYKIFQSRVRDASESVSTSKNTLSRNIASFLENEAKKLAFDAAWLDFQARQIVKKKIANFTQSGQRSIPRVLYMSYVHDCVSLGMCLDRARWFVHHECCVRSKIQHPDQHLAEQMRACPQCKAENLSSAQSCQKCGCDLLLHCPICKHLELVDNKYCSKCTFPLSEREAVLSRIDAAEKALRSADATGLSLALQHLHPYRAKLASYALYETQLSAIKDQKAKNELHAIVSSLAAPSRGDISPLGEHALRISWTPLMRNQSPYAQSSIARSEGGILPLGYVLIRKAGGVPSSVGDGEQIAKLSSLSYDDRTIVPGICYGYAVFASCGDYLISKGCSCGVGQIIADASHFHASSVESSIQLTWKPQPGAKGSYLVRKKNAMPQHLQDGTLMRLPAGTSQYQDNKGIEVGINYGYMLVHYYIDIRGQELRSSPVSLMVKSMQPPTAIQNHDWSFRYENGKLSIQWTRPAKGELQWYLTSAILLPSASLVSASALTQQSGWRALSLVDNLNGQAYEKLDISCYRYLTPVVHSDGQAIVCQSRELNYHAGITHLEQQRIASDLRLSWRWPANCQEVLILYSTDSFATSPEQAGQYSQKVCTRKQYELNQFLRLPSIGNENCFVSIFAKIGSPPNTFYSDVVCICSLTQSMQISYKLSSSRAALLFGKKSWKIVVTSNQSRIPALELRRKAHSLPLSKNDGERVACSDAVTLNKLSIPIDDRMVRDNFCYRLFLRNEQDNKVWIFDHPSKEESRISL